MAVTKTNWFCCAFVSVLVDLPAENSACLAQGALLARYRKGKKKNNARNF